METFNSFVSSQLFSSHVRKRRAVVPNLPFAPPPFLAWQVYQHSTHETAGASLSLRQLLTLYCIPNRGFPSFLALKTLPPSTTFTLFFFLTSK